MNEFDKERLDFAKFQKTAEKQCLPFFRRALKKHIEPLMKYAENNGVDAIPSSSISTLLDNSVWGKTYDQVYSLIGSKFARREYYNQKRLDTGAEEKGVIDFLLNLWSQKLREYALQYTFNIQQELNDTTVRLIQEALGQDYELGLDAQGKLRLFFKKIREQNYLRSLVISRTESTTIANLGKDIGARSWLEESGSQGYHVWLGRIKNERQTHLAVNNTIVPLDTPFTVGGELSLRPGDVNLSAAERINCRCTTSIFSETRYNSLINRGRIVDGKLVGAS